MQFRQGSAELGRVSINCETIYITPAFCVDTNSIFHARMRCRLPIAQLYFWNVHFASISQSSLRIESRLLDLILHLLCIMFFSLQLYSCKVRHFVRIPALSTVPKVVEGSSDKNIVLRMARNVGAEAMVSAVESSVKPRMKGKDTAALEVCTVRERPTNLLSFSSAYRSPLRDNCGVSVGLHSYMRHFNCTILFAL